MFFSKIRIMAGVLALSTSPQAASQALAMAQDEPSTANVAEAADPVETAKEYAKTLTENATAALTNEAASEAEKLAAFQQVLADGLALDVIGKFMLGESRKVMSQEQLDRYYTVFPQYITKQYADQFSEIVGRPLEITDAKALGKRDVIVRTQFERKDGSPVLVDWRVRRLRSGEQKAIDIIVSGVSVMLVKREEFSSFIALNSIDALLDTLEKEAAA